MFRNGEGRMRGVDLVVAILDKSQCLCSNKIHSQSDRHSPRNYQNAYSRSLPFLNIQTTYLTLRLNLGF